MTREQFRRYAHQVIDLLEQELTRPQVRGYAKVYKDRAVVKLVTEYERKP